MKVDVLLCLGQGVDMGEGKRNMYDCACARVWIWGRDEGRCVAVFGTGCGYGRGRMGDVFLCLGQGVGMGEGGREMCVCIWDKGVDMGEGGMGDVCLCLGQGVDMGEGKREMFGMGQGVK